MSNWGLRDKEDLSQRDPLVDASYDGEIRDLGEVIIAPMATAKWYHKLNFFHDY